MKIKLRKKFLPIATAVFGKEEEKEIIAAMRSGWITLGPRTKQFEEDLAKYIGCKYVVAVNSCSAALHLAVVAAGIGPGDEVITTTFTFAATLNAIIHTGAKPVLVDIDPKTYNIDYTQIEAAITKKTKAILPVHYGGQPVNLTKIRQIAKAHNLIVIEDAAHAIGTEYKGKKIGTISEMACFSFHPVKNMTTGDGGAVATNDPKLAEKLMMLRVNGMDKESWKRNTTSGSWDYAITVLGFKYHLNDLGAALGIHQLKKLDKFISIRSKVAATYDKAFSKISELTVPFSDPAHRHAHNLYPLLIDTTNLSLTRNQIMEELKKYNVGSIVYYRPMHMQPYYQQSLKLKVGMFPVAEKVFEQLVCLPIYAGMTVEDAKYVTEVLKNILTQARKK